MSVAMSPPTPTADPTREEIDCRTLAAASLIRKQWPDCLAPEDDRRSATVVVTGDALDHWIAEMGEIARRDWAALDERHGQVTLTERERAEIDWQRTNVPHARSCKAIAQGHGVGDWLAHYDHTLSVDEHRDVYAREACDGPTLRELPTDGRWR